MRLDLTGVRLVLDDLLIRSRTVVDVVDLHVVACTSTLPDYEIELRSVYVADPDAIESVDGTAVTMLASAPRYGMTELHQHQREPGHVPVTYERRRCVHDHLFLLNGWVTHVLPEVELRIETHGDDLEDVDRAPVP